MVRQAPSYEERLKSRDVRELLSDLKKSRICLFSTVQSSLQGLVCLFLSAAGINDVQIDYGKTRPGDVKRNYSDTSKTQKLLGSRAEVDLVEGLTRTVHWFINRM